MKPLRTKKKTYVSPENVLAQVYGKTSLELNMSENRRDEVITAAIFTSFWNQEFGTHFALPRDFKKFDPKQDAQGIDIVVFDKKSKRRKKMQVKGVHIQRSIKRRQFHSTKGVARVLGAKTQRQIKRDSEELTEIMQKELEKIIHDYSGLFLIIHVSADLATQTSLEIAMKKSQEYVSGFKAKEVWFLRNIPVRAIRGRHSLVNCYAYKLIKVFPDRHTYGFSFAI